MSLKTRAARLRSLTIKAEFFRSLTKRSNIKVITNKAARFMSPYKLGKGKCASMGGYVWVREVTYMAVAGFHAVSSGCECRRGGCVKNKIKGDVLNIGLVK